MIKKTLALILCAAMCLTFFGCGGDSPEMLCRLGDRYMNEGEYFKAADAFGQAINIDPSCAEAYEGRADAYIGLDNPSGAAEDYEAAIAYAGDSPELYAKLIDAYTAAGDVEGAALARVCAASATGDDRFADEASAAQDTQADAQAESTQAGIIDETDVNEFLANHAMQMKSSMFYLTPDEVADHDYMFGIFMDSLPFMNIMDEYPFATYTIDEGSEAETAEAKQIMGKLGGEDFYRVYVINNTRLQRFFDGIWGRDRINVRAFNYYGERSVGVTQLSNDKTSVGAWGLGGIGSNAHIEYNIVDLKIQGMLAILTIEALLYSRAG